MRRALVFSTLVLSIVIATAAQSQRRPRPDIPLSQDASQVQTVLKDAGMRLVEFRKVLEGDFKALALTRAAEGALADPMQPTVALQKAYDAVDKALQVLPSHEDNLWFRQALISMRRSLDDALRSPATADFGRLRGLLQNDCIAAGERVAFRHATRLQRDIDEWLQAQTWINDHLGRLSEATREALVVAQGRD